MGEWLDPFLSRNGTADEGIDESDEGYEGHEDEKGVRYRQGQIRPRSSLQRHKTENSHWYDEGQAHEEQNRENCVQSEVCCSQETICKRSRPLDQGCRGGPESFGSSRLRSCKWKDSTRESNLCKS